LKAGIERRAIRARMMADTCIYIYARETQRERAVPNLEEWCGDGDSKLYTRSQIPLSRAMRAELARELPGG
jgi:hypothetical protein